MPKKRTTKKKSTTSESPPQPCCMQGCPNQAHPDADGYCTLHATLVDLTATSMEAAARAFNKGDVRGGVVRGLAGLFFNHSEPLVRATVDAAARRAAQPQPQPRPRTQQRRSPPPPPPSPWTVLGLDPATATAADVRRVVKALSQVYHPDRGAGGISRGQMAVINEAAQACLDQLKKRGK
jgi:hypothetical protein